MFEVISKIWYFIVVLPLIILLEGNKMFSNFLKKKNIYSRWDFWYLLLFILIVLFIILWAKGY